MDLGKLFSEYWQEYARNAGAIPLSFTGYQVQDFTNGVRNVVLPIKVRALHSSFTFNHHIRVLSFVGKAPTLEYTQDPDGTVLLQNLVFRGEHDALVLPAIAARLSKLGVHQITLSFAGIRQTFFLPNTDQAVLFHSKRGVERVLFFTPGHYVKALNVVVPSELADMFLGTEPAYILYYHERGAGGMYKVFNQNGYRLDSFIHSSQKFNRYSRLHMLAHLARLRHKSRLKDPLKYFTWLAQKNLEVVS